MSKTLAIETPRGEFLWVVISGEGKENLSGKLQYKVDLLLEGQDAEDLKAKIDAYWAENKPKDFKKAPKSTGYYEHAIPTGEVAEDGTKVMAPTGKTLFSFKTDTLWPDGKQKIIPVKNSKGNTVVLGETKIGNGSIGRIAGAVGIYTVKAPKGTSIIDAGTTLYLNAIKLLKLEEYVGGPEFSESDEDSEFEAVGEEFVGTEAPAEAPARTRL